jgi:hypothetical protein
MSELNLNQKIIEIRKLVKVLKKDTKGNNHNYVSEDQILNAISDKMDELNLLLEPQILNGTAKSYPHTYTTAKGKIINEIVYSADMTFTWIDASNGESKIIQWTMAGQMGDISQSQGSALTYANRYFLLKYFQVSTSEQDPDAVRARMAKERYKDYEIFAGMFLPHNDAINIVKGACKELSLRLGVRAEDLATSFKDRNWHNLKDANLDSWFGLERNLRSLNNPEHEWHKLYNTNSRAKNVVELRKEITYLSSQEQFGKLAMSKAKDRNEQLEIIDFYEMGNIDLNKYLGIE